LEEADKVSRLIKITLTAPESNLRQEWNQWRDHSIKLESALTGPRFGPVTEKLAAEVREQFAPLAKQLGLSAQAALQRLKLRSTFVEFLSDHTWSEPGRVVKPLSARLILDVTCAFIGNALLIPLRIEESLAKVVGRITAYPPHIRAWAQWRLSKSGRRWGQAQVTRINEWLTLNTRPRRSRARSK
jgi:AbiV family abortive infection protein